jgi:prepilin-type N-terminal cleavage/methylation domain-containing protein
MRAGGFTLVEILIVVAILGILAMVVVPSITSAVQDSKESAAARIQQLIQKQIVLYKSEHGGLSPHLDQTGSPDTANFVARLTNRTDSSGKLESNGTCGPYLTSWSANPLADPARADEVQFGVLRNGNGATGWYYNTRTHEFKANDAISIEKEQTAIIVSGG